VCGSEGTGRLERNIQSFGQAQPIASQVMPKSLTFDKLSGNDLLAANFSELIDGEDVWVVERRCSLRLLLKASQSSFVSGVISGQELERNSPIEPRVSRQIDLAHATSSEQPNDGVVTEGLAFSEFGLPSCEEARSQFKCRPIDKAQPLLIRCYQRFNFSLQFHVADAGALDERATFLGFQLYGGLEYLLNLLPAFRSHAYVVSVNPGSYCYKRESRMKSIMPCSFHDATTLLLTSTRASQ
jgi:hypothetical protein